MLKRTAKAVLGLFFFAATFYIFSGYTYANEPVVYLQNNIHYQQGDKDAKASYANWTDPGPGHKILPVNTPVTIGNFSRGFSITSVKDDKTIYFEFHKVRMDMSKEAYLEIITSPTKVSLDGLSSKDLKGIEDGKAYVGMTKDGVRMALGYPAVHRTASLDSNTWIYWTNRFRSIAVEFDDKGKVKSAP